MLAYPKGADVLMAGQRSRPTRGFTLVELMITITVLSILVLAAAPSLRLWIFNTRVRSAAEVLQNGLRLAQSEAVRQSRQIEFTRTGSNWAAQIVPNASDAARATTVVGGGPLAGSTEGVTVTNGPASLCFSSLGNLVVNTATPSGGACAVGAAVFDIAHASSDRPLRVQVSINGRVRMCDPARTLSATNPDGC